MTPYRAALEIYTVFLVWWVIPLTLLALWERYGHLRYREQPGRAVPLTVGEQTKTIRVMSPGELDDLLANGKIIMQDME